MVWSGLVATTSFGGGMITFLNFLGGGAVVVIMMELVPIDSLGRFSNAGFIQCDQQFTVLCIPIFRFQLIQWFFDNKF